MSRLIEVKVASVEENTGRLVLRETEEIDDVVNHHTNTAYFFGGNSNPPPKVGEVLLIRYGFNWSRSEAKEAVLDCFRPHELKEPLPA